MVGSSLLLLLSSCSKPQVEVEFENGWIRPLIGTRTTTAGYVQIQNNRIETLVFTEANSSTIEKIEFHVTTKSRGTHQMKLLEQLEIKPGQSLDLKPGGYHLMLFGVQNGETTTHRIEFETGNGEVFSHEFVVQDDS
ncbi:MAG: copper chaperone PCu(A)C [Gammaproteobacteria bacterium]|nr:copper chaperone PCu(A)C [Gammaproteobacteria bacterium]MDE0403017.1 copper chaperone PCu(A)C [Gammaproteobacteria bacterium]